MPDKIDFDDLDIQNLFNNFYIVPEYQREYVWKEKEVLLLLNDIYGNYDSNPNSEYFLGSIVVCKPKGSIKYEVIDGQQRLITLSLLLNNLAQIYKNKGEEHSIIDRLLFSQKISESGETIKSYMVEIQYDGKDVLYDLYKKNDEDIEFSMKEGLPGKTIFEAHRNISIFFKENFDHETDFEEIKRFLGYILNKVKLIQIETPEIGSALKIFETINERGISLDHFDLLKNLIFIQVERKEFQKLQKEWDKFKQILIGKKQKEKPLRFLRYFIMSNYEVAKDSRGTNIVREDDIYQWFIENKKTCNFDTDPFGFVRKLQNHSLFYMNLIKKRYSDDLNTNIENIFNLVGSAFKQHFILLLSAIKLKSEYFNHLVQQLEVLLFYYNITKEPPRDVEKRFAGWAKEIRDIKNESSLNEFINKRIRADVENRSEEYQRRFMSLHSTEMQKYKLKYILAKLAQYIDRERLGDNTDMSIIPYLGKYIHIEHILPQDPTPEIIKDFCNGDKKKYNDYKERLGNLTLLEKPINSSIKRDFYNEKRVE